MDVYTLDSGIEQLPAWVFWQYLCALNSPSAVLGLTLARNESASRVCVRRLLIIAVHALFRSIKGKTGERGEIIFANDQKGSNLLHKTARPS